MGRGEGGFQRARGRGADKGVQPDRGDRLQAVDRVPAGCASEAHGCKLCGAADGAAAHDADVLHHGLAEIYGGL